MFNIKSYEKPASVEEAVHFLKMNPEARLIAGGTEVLVRQREDHDSFNHLVDIHDMEELNTVYCNENEDLIIGSGVCFTDLAENPLISSHIPVLKEAVLTIGGPQVRNVATIGGNICNGAPCADSGPPLLALNATVVVNGMNGTYEIPLEKFFIRPGKVALAHHEIVTAFKIRNIDYEGFHGHYLKYAMRNAMDIATIGCAAVCKIENDTLQDLRISYGVAAPTHIRCPSAEKKARERPVTAELLENISKWVLDDVNPRSSWRASKEFRLHIIATLVRNCIEQTVLSAGGTIK